ncbi:interferon-induced protein with tetratricopeptide repeats 1-like [Garra rufa]|uniref:interferon-induced protein with tetratricopeptide repeats 1-like n=1 Tax=Garra rufa TaxID=137080 RepID=UPI003CCE9C35
MDSSLKQHLEKLECHFTWDLSSSKNELKALLRDLKDVDQQTCTWLLHYYNLLGYIQHALGSNTEALKYLHQAEMVTEEQETEESGVRLQVNKANLAWIYFYLGEMEKSKGYLEEVERLQQMYPAPSECDLHPEVSGEKGWTLLKFNKSKKHQAIDYFKKALKAEPERTKWQKGLALAISKAHTDQNCTPELKAKILTQLKTAHEKEPNNLLLYGLYLEKLSEVQSEENEREMQALLEKAFETEDLECLGTILRYFRTISVDKAIREAERAREKFPNSSRVLKLLAICNKWKVYNRYTDRQERVTLARKSIGLFEEVVRHYPDSLREKIALASMYNYANYNEKADEIYQQLVSEIDDFPPPSQQHIYYSYAHFLHHTRKPGSINFHIKVAEIPVNTTYRENSIKVLEKIVREGKSPLCKKIVDVLKAIQLEL